MEAAAILICPDGSRAGVRELVARLVSFGVAVTTVLELAGAVELSAGHPAPPCLLLDLSHLGGQRLDADDATAAIRHVVELLPHSQPVVVLGEADASMILACVRAGAADAIVLNDDGLADVHEVVERSCRSQLAAAAAATAADETISAQRAMIEDLLKDLIRTERRSIDAEDLLAAQRKITGEHAPIIETRSPAILLVEAEREVADELADRLEAVGITTFAYVTGDEAVREAETLFSTTGLDLALIAVQLPGIDGLETVRRLRGKIHGLPAFLMTSVIDASLASSAANLGVVGFVQKPLEDLDDVVTRLAALARASLERTREQAYLERIKERHERVLARYRSLPRGS